MSAGEAPGTHVFELTGGDPCLDFTNTMGGTRERPNEHLNDYADLLAFVRQAELVPSAAVARLAAAARRDPAAARAALARVKDAREIVYRVLSAIAGGGRPAPADLDALPEALAATGARRRVVARGGAFVTAWDGDPARLDWPAGPFLHAAIDLLTSGRLDRLRECGSETCAWLFLDSSKNASKRWCDMKTCGNVAKARRFRERHRGASA